MIAVGPRAEGFVQPAMPSGRRKLLGALCYRNRQEDGLRPGLLDDRCL